MITLKQKADIILSHIREGKSFSQIERETGINRKTVSSYIREYETRKEELLNKKDSCEELELIIEELVSAPKYDTSKRKSRKVTDEILERIDVFLKENEEKRNTGRSKQQMKKIDIYEKLIDEGFEISYPTIVREVRKKERKRKEAYIKQDYIYGEVCEFDWGEVKLFLDGKLKKIQMSVFTSAAGNYRNAHLYHSQKMECFIDAHVEFFDEIQGSYRTMVYDNLRTAVKRFVGRTEKEATEDLIKLSLYYGFKYRFCNTARGNEKGHVERSVEYIRRKVFSRRDTFESLEEANEYLQQELKRLNSRPQKLHQGQTAFDIFDKERKYLIPAMPKYDAARTATLRVDNYSTIIIDECRYSVPDDLVGEYVFAKIYPAKVVAYYNNEKIAVHTKKHGVHEWSMNLEHYLNTIKKKPGALANSLALKQAHQRLQQIYKQYYIRREKDFIELLELIGEKSLEEVEQALSKLEKISPISINTEKIKTLCNRSEKDKVLSKSSSQDEIVKKANEILQAYGALLKQDDMDFDQEVPII